MRRMLTGMLLAGGLICGCRQEAETRATPQVMAPEAAAMAPVAAVPVDSARLVGNWQRPDGGYVLEIRAAHAEGTLEAGYFNPRPINVSQARWSRGADGGLDVFIELRDANYPGATYKLKYRAAEGAMTGLYHQPALGQTFEVEFVRQK